MQTRQLEDSHPIQYVWKEISFRNRGGLCRSLFPMDPHTHPLKSCLRLSPLPRCLLSVRRVSIAAANCFSAREAKQGIFLRKHINTAPEGKKEMRGAQIVNESRTRRQRSVVGGSLVSSFATIFLCVDNSTHGQLIYSDETLGACIHTPQPDHFI